MILKDTLSLEVKLGRFKDRDGIVLVDLDAKTGEPIDEQPLEEILKYFMDKNVKIKIEAVKDLM